MFARWYQPIRTWRRQMRRQTCQAIYTALVLSAIVVPILLLVLPAGWQFLATVGVIVAGVGGNLLANVIQNWRDRSAPGALGAGRLRYLQGLSQYCQTLPLAALGGEEGLDRGPTLDQVYIEIDTTTQVGRDEGEPQSLRRDPRPRVEDMEGIERMGREADPIPLSAQDALAQEHRLVLLGGAGSGKSTFVRLVLSKLARANLDATIMAPTGLSPDLLPVLVTLRYLAPRLAQLNLGTLSDYDRRQCLAETLCDQACADLERLKAQDFAPGLREALSTGRCLLVLDGLDEVPQDMRRRVREVVDAVLSTYHAQRVIVTCRGRSYVADAVLPDFHAYTLADFDTDKIERFAHAWYNAQQALDRVDALQAQNKAADLSRAAVALHALAANPMLLTTMSIIHQRDTRLPEERVVLYHLAVDVLLRRWHQSKAGETSLEADPELSPVLPGARRLREAIEGLAYQLHSEQQAGRAVDGLPRGDALTFLESERYLGHVNQANAFLNYVDITSGLLMGQGGRLDQPNTYSFPHRTFQEYLAGCHLMSQRNRKDVLWEHAGAGDFWSLAMQLGAEELLHNRRGQNELLDLAYALSPSSDPMGNQAQRAALWSSSMVALVDQQEVEQDTAGGKAYLKRLQPSLVCCLRGSLSAPERAEAGNALARLGDPRFRADRWYLPDELQLGFVEIPAGDFLMGSDPKRDSAAQNDEQPQHCVFLSTYFIARYPVTVAQFGAFVKASGYDWAGEKRGQGEANHPVVHVSWDDAQAYCQWLTEQLRSWAETPEPLAAFLRDGGCLTLPSEAQWEKASRGPDGRLYPWDDQAEPNRANYRETGIGTTSPAGCFPAGISPYQVEEMSGNVFEWVQDWYEEGYYSKSPERDPQGPAAGAYRVIRGGSWSDSARNARSALRGRLPPGYRVGVLGFRCLSSGREPESGAQGKP